MSSSSRVRASSVGPTTEPACKASVRAVPATPAGQVAPIAYPAAYNDPICAALFLLSFVAAAGVDWKIFTAFPRALSTWSSYNTLAERFIQGLFAHGLVMLQPLVIALAMVGGLCGLLGEGGLWADGL